MKIHIRQNLIKRCIREGRGREGRPVVYFDWQTWQISAFSRFRDVRLWDWRRVICHLVRHVLWTYLDDPMHLQGDIKSRKSPVSKHILQLSVIVKICGLYGS